MDNFHSQVSCFKPKVVHYPNKGDGRDGYITFDHGGLVNTNPKPDIFTRQGNLASIKTYSKPHPLVQSPLVGYRSDGSGRDFYVTVNSGGLYSPYKVGNDQQRFKDSLRHDPPSSFSLTTQSFFSYRGREMLANQSKKVKEVTERLFSNSPRKIKRRNS